MTNKTILTVKTFIPLDNLKPGLIVEIVLQKDRLGVLSLYGIITHVGNGQVQLVILGPELRVHRLYGGEGLDQGLGELSPGYREFVDT